MARQPAVYILASKRNGTLYIGVTSGLQKRNWEHKNDLVDGFTKKYGVHRLVYYELHGEMVSAITRQKQIKKWNHAGKLELIEAKSEMDRSVRRDSVRGTKCLDSRVRGNDGSVESVTLVNLLD